MRASVSKSRSSNSRDGKLVPSLLRWYRRHRRDLPWRGTRDPYRVWVSEIMLQQTRVATVVPYYERFLKRFPSVESLAKVREQTLLECWSGLGYYRRACMMRAAARKVVSEHSGAFPKSFEELRDLPGIGDYTAAAVASIAFERPCAVVDGNVIRLLTRLDDDSRDVTSSRVRRDLQTRAQQLIAAAGPRSRGAFNQAMMELGSLLCTRRKPRCLICPVASYCKARKKGVQEQRPVKLEKRRPVRLQLAVALVERGRKILLRQRPREDPLMPGFWELPLAEGSRLGADCFLPLGIERRKRLGTFRHGITFREYRGSVYRGELPVQPPDGYRWVSPERLKKLPLTTITRKALAAARGLARTPCRIRSSGSP